MGLCKKKRMDEEENDRMLWGLRRLMVYDMHMYYRALEYRLQQRGQELNAFVVLGNLIQYDGCNQRELAEYCHMRPSNLTNIMRRYEERGWLRRSPGPLHRETLVFVTNEGKQEFESLMVTFNEVEEMMFAGFTEEEKKALEKSYIRIGNNIYDAELAQGRIHFAGVRPDEIEKPVT